MAGTEEPTPFTCKIYVNEDEIYSGDLNEVPPKFRNTIKRDLSEWANSLGKRGLNELIYSHLAWYEDKETYCENCEKSVNLEGGAECGDCGEKLSQRYLYERNSKLDMIITCIGMITRVQVSED
ncbi:MAG: hypothetical protein RIG61_09640 [Deltaproteobacteria bacterium]